jgi:hypothetical protein
MAKSIRAGALRFTRLDAARALHAHQRALERRGVADLTLVLQTFALRGAAAGELFGVSRQAVDHWLAKGVPVLRLADVGRAADAARAMRDYFREERIPQIAREPLPGLDGRTVLQVVRDEPRRVIELLERTRSYVPPP